jgi:hypothetical protein
MRAHLRSKGHLLTPALKEIPRTRAECLLQWHTKYRHENILFVDEKIFTIKGQYNNQNNKIYAQMSLEVSSERQGGHHPSYVMVWWGLSHQGVTPLHFCKKGVKLVPEHIKRTCYKQLSLFSGQEWVFQQDSAPAHKPKTTKEWLRRNVLGCFSAENWPSGSQTSTSWIINCGLFWRTWHVVSITAAWGARRDLFVQIAAKIPLEMVHAATAEWPELVSWQRAAILRDVIMDEILTTIAYKLFGLKSECFV